MVLFLTRFFKLVLSNAIISGVFQKLNCMGNIEIHYFLSCTVEGKDVSETAKLANFLHLKDTILHLLERDSELKELGQGLGEGDYFGPVDTTMATCEAGQP